MNCAGVAIIKKRTDERWPRSNPLGSSIVLLGRLYGSRQGGHKLAEFTRFGCLSLLNRQIVRFMLLRVFKANRTVPTKICLGMRQHVWSSWSHETQLRQVDTDIGTLSWS
jgi:hypothetical protein